MKKITSLAVALLAVAFSASAQYNVSGHKFFDNWSIGVDGGVSTNLHDWDNPNGGVVGLQLTKAITPVISVEIAGQMGFNNNANWNIPHSGTAVDNATGLLSAKVNLMNWWGGYKGQPRVFEIQTRLGAGYMRDFNTAGDIPAGRQNAGIVKAGLDFDFNLGSKKAWALSLRPAVVMKTNNGDAWCDNSSACTKYTHNALFQATAGITYRFKTSNGSHNFVAVAPVEVTRVVEKIVEKPVEKIVEKRVEVPGKTTANIYVVEFQQNSSVLSSAAKATLNEVDTNATVALDAYASPEGAKAYNQKLSQRRADEVKKYLEGRGVKVASATGHGAESKSSQRIVYVRVK